MSADLEEAIKLLRRDLGTLCGTRRRLKRWNREGYPPEGASFHEINQAIMEIENFLETVSEELKQ